MNNTETVSETPHINFRKIRIKVGHRQDTNICRLNSPRGMIEEMFTDLILNANLG